MSQHKSKISDLFLDEKEDDYIITNENIYETTLDISLNLEIRMRALLEYCKRNVDHVIDLIVKINSMYEMSNISTLKEYLIAICKSDIDPFLSSLSAKSLFMVNENDEDSQDALFIVYSKFSDKINTSYKIDFIKTIMQFEKYREQTLIFFNDIIIICI